MSIQSQLDQLGIALPPVAVPAAAYVPFVRTGNLVFLSGHIARKDGKPWIGRLGQDMATAQGAEAARAVATRFSTVKPKCLKSTGAGADSP